VAAERRSATRHVTTPARPHLLQALAQLRFPGSPFSHADNLAALAWQHLLQSVSSAAAAASSSSSGSSAGSSLDPARSLALLWQLQALDSGGSGGSGGGGAPMALDVLAAEVKAAAGRCRMMWWRRQLPATERVCRSACLEEP
jgi:hypothetical protein